MDSVCPLSPHVITKKESTRQWQEVSRNKLATDLYLAGKITLNYAEETS